VGNGAIPPSGAAITALTYRYVVGGTSGNVGGGAITSLRTPVAGITGVTNLAASTGAADQQSIDDAMRLAPESIKARDRAVTADDYEFLAAESSTEVAIVRCLPPRVNDATVKAPFVAGDPWTFAAIDRSPGNVTVIIVSDQGPAVPRPDPPPDLIWLVQTYLDKRRTVTARLAVTGPRYVPIQVQVTAIPWQSAINQGLIASPNDLAASISAKIQQYLHPVHGGSDGSGWQVGQSVYIADLFKFIQPSDTIGFISTISLMAETPLYHFPPYGTGAPNTPLGSTERPVQPGPPGVWVWIMDYELVCYGTTSQVTLGAAM
jgi:predicted phage baseplate assembly protein